MQPNRYFKSLADYIDRIIGEKYDVCETCRNEIEYMRLRAADIEDDLQHEEEELQRIKRKSALT
jgi:hypothetical protein